jgi:hypothetical protein
MPLRPQPRDQWIGSSDEQRRRRLALVANHVHFLLLPERPVTNLGSAALSCVLAQLSADWQARHAHPILVVETFVDPAYFQGTVYPAGGWSELGQSKGSGRKAHDYYEAYDRPKRLFPRELVPAASPRPNAPRSVSAPPPRANILPPSQPTFSRLFKRLSAARVERALLDHQHQVRGAPPATELIDLDGKVPAPGGGLDVVSAVTSPSQYFFGKRSGRGQDRRDPVRPRDHYGTSRQLLDVGQRQSAKCPNGGANECARSGHPALDRPR